LVVADEAHHYTAQSWLTVIRHYLSNPAFRLLGVTATADRNDDRDLGALYEKLAFRYPLHEAIADGYLVGLRKRSVVVDGLEFSRIRTKRSADGGRDFVESELDAVMGSGATSSPPAAAAPPSRRSTSY
jgi:superfamily II DNA or RNA helicase